MAKKKELSTHDIRSRVYRKSKLVDQTANQLYSQGRQVNPAAVTRTLMKKLNIPEKNFLDAADTVKEVLKSKGWIREDIWG